MRNDVTANWNWNLIKNENGNYTYDQTQLAVLMDIREQLKQLNSLLTCPNFINMPRDLRIVARNTTKRKRRA